MTDNLVRRRERKLRMTSRCNLDKNIFIFIYIIIVIYTPSVTTNDACSTSLCKCTDRMAECVGLNLTYIPVFPKGIYKIIFKNNSLPYVNASTFRNVSKLDLKSLHLTFNRIENIEEDSFKHLKSLRALDLSRNNISEKCLYSIFTENTKRLEKVVIKHKGLKKIPGDIFRNFSSFNLQSLDFSWNEITEFNFSVIREANLLENLFLKENSIQSLVLDGLPYLTNLSLVGNKLTTLPNFCESNNLFPRLLEIKLAVNFIERYTPSYLNCLTNLTSLYLSENVIRLLDTDYFHSLPSLTFISIQTQRPRGVSYLRFEDRVFNNTNLKKIQFSDNMLPSAGFSKHAFDGCDSLESLDLSLNHFAKNTEILESTLSGVPSLKTLYLHDSRLNYIPNVVKTKLHNLKFLFISRNNIVSWPNDFFFHNILLTDLNLRSNKIRSVTREMFPDYLRRRLHNITIRGNPLECNCGLVWFVNWVHNAKSKFKDFEQYPCMNITERICLKNTQAFISVTTVACILILLLLPVSTVYKYRWSIKYHIYMWRYRPLQLKDIAEKHFKYDVFVSYCVSDSAWVLHGLVPVFEEREHMKLCIHERDFEGGRLIIDNILHHMENSRKCLIVLSNEFAKSEWCQYEMSLAQKLVMDMCIQSLVVVLMEDIDAENMSRSLHALLTTTTYIYWNIEEEDERVLWERLQRSLRGTEVQNNLLEMI